MTRILLLFAGVLFVLSSCVPTKKYVLLQKNDLNRKDLPIDTVLRSYQLKLSNYKIQPQDLLSIDVKTLTPDEYNFFKELNPVQAGGGGMGVGQQNGFMVDNDGNINIPVMGKVKLGGLTVFESETKMQEILMGALRDPIVRIRLQNFRFTFVGELNTQVTSFNPRISVMEAIAMAGGLPEFANRENIKIIRQRGDQVDVLYINLLDEAFVTSPYFYLQQNDIIVVSTLKQKQARAYFTQNTSLVFSLISFVLFIVTLSRL